MPPEFLEKQNLISKEVWIDRRVKDLIKELREHYSGYNIYRVPYVPDYDYCLALIKEIDDLILILKSL